MNGKQSKLQKLQLEIKVKDGIIAALVNVISTNNIKIPIKVLSIIEALYARKEKNETAQ
jgi:hypothetical protein